MIGGNIGSPIGGIVTAVGTVDAVGASAGVATAAAVGASFADAAGSSTAQATVAGVGAPFADATGSAAGLATVSGIGSALADSVGASAGVATPTAVGEPFFDGSGASDGTGTADADASPGFVPRGGDWLASPAQIRAYQAHLRRMEAQQDRDARARRQLERRIGETLKWAYLRATDPEAAEALEQALRLAALQALGAQGTDDAYQADWQALLSSLEATEGFLEQMEAYRAEVEREALEQENIEAILLLAA